MPGSVVNSAVRPSRTAAWSSTMTTRSSRPHGTVGTGSTLIGHLHEAPTSVDASVPSPTTAVRRHLPTRARTSAHWTGVEPVSGDDRCYDDQSMVRGPSRKQRSMHSPTTGKGSPMKLIPALAVTAVLAAVPTSMGAAALASDADTAT